MSSHLPGVYQAALHRRAQQRKLRDNFHTAPGFRWLGSLYSCVPDPELPWDPAVVAAIQRRDPGFIPMIVYSRYLSSADFASERVYTIKRHAAGRHIARPKTPKAPFYVLMPPGATFPKPNQIDDILHEGPRDPHGPFVRGGFCPLDWRLAWEPLVALTSAQLRKQHIEDPDEKERKEFLALVEEEARANAEIDRYFQKKLAQMSDLEIQQFIDRQAARMPIREVSRPVRVFYGAAGGGVVVPGSHSNQ